ncbi:hypothetical protein Q8A67_023197 [Cirrhinus molitorella]|uniref:Uncharacterized protein n=1 Tax=Cirrhinus molitorella TaxID=172907 RepID=A0AA88NZI2_9TELE|nr:hypothetical protein Q8A67_023197 [Cirrhinus molitorella]
MFVQESSIGSVLHPLASALHWQTWHKTLAFPLLSGMFSHTRKKKCGQFPIELLHKRGLTNKTVLTRLCIPGAAPLPPTRAFKASQGKQLCSGAEIWPATISHCTNTGLGWLLSDWPSPRPCDSGLAGCSPATDTVDGLLGWRLSLVQNGVSLRLTP